MSEYTADAYSVLGVKKDATEKEIKTAYRKLALKHHPDRHTEEAAKEEATTKFAAIANAYEILSDEHLRREYDRSHSTHSSSSPGKASADSSEPMGFRYHFSDPYEVFKRDFRQQFGIEYPGAKYDFVDFDKPIVNPSTPAMITDGKDKTKKGGHKQKQGASNSDADAKKKRGFNPFRRNKTKVDETKNNKAVENQIVVRGKNKEPNNQLAKSNNSALTAPSSNSTAIVKVEKRNNRPISMDVKSEKNGKVTTTTTTITRPDGTVETMVMKQGLPGKAKNKQPLMIGNGTANPKMLKSDGKEKNARLTNGTGKKPKQLALANEAHNSKPKRKLLGYGGKQ